MAASEVQSGSPQEGFSRQRTVLRQLSSFIRKPPSLQGLSQLSQLAADCDLSYCPLLLTAAFPYLSQTLAQWLRISQQSRNAAILFLQLLTLRLQKTRLDWLQTKLAPLRLKFQRVMGRPMGRLPPDHLSPCKAEEQLSEYQSHKQIGLEKQVQLSGETSSSQARLQPQLRLTDKPQLSRLQTLRQLYFKASIRKKLPSSDNEDSSDSSEEKAQNYVSNCRDCATCLSWVREDEDLSYPLPKQPISFFGPLSLMPEFKEPLLEQIVAFLNGKGGVVLLGCRQKSGGRVEAVVESISQNLKENIENRLQKWLQAIYQPVTLKRQVDLTWIPIGCPQQFVKGGFLLRLVVEPIDPSITSFYSLTTPHFAQQTALGPIGLEGEAVYRLMQQRFNSAQASRTLNGLRERGNWMPGLPLHLGLCQLPEKGEPQYAGQPIGPGIGIVEKREGNPLLQNHQNFKSVSLLIVSEKGKQSVEKILQKTQKIDVMIERAFPERKFWLASTTWLLWHSIKFQKVMTGVKKNIRELSKANENKPPGLISTCPCLKVIDGPLDQEKVAELITVAKKEAGEQVKHSLINEYDYFQCEAPITAVFLYFYLNDKYRLKSVFQKLNPTKHKHTRPSHKDSRFAQNSTRREDRFKIEKEEKQQSEDIHPEQGSPNKKPDKSSSRRKAIRSDSSSGNSVEGKEQQKGDAPDRAEEPAKQVERVLLCWYMDQFYSKFYYYNDWQVVTYDAYNQMVATRNYDQAQYDLAYYYSQCQNTYAYHQ